MSKTDKLIKEAVVNLRKYDYDQVIELCDEILKIEPESVWALRYKGISLSQQGNYEAGLEYHRKVEALVDDEDDEITNSELAFLTEKLGMYEEALKYHKRNKTTMKKFYVKRVLIKMNDYNQLIECYDKKLNYLKGIERSPETIRRNIVLLEEKAFFQYKLGNINEAIESFKQVIQLYNEIKEGLPAYRDNFKEWYEMLDEYLVKYEAESFFENLFNLDNLKIWKQKINNKIHQSQDSLFYCELLHELYPENTKILYIAGMTAKYYDGIIAQDYFKQLLEIKPEHKEVIFELLDSYSNYYSKDTQLKLIDEKLYIDKIRVKLLERKIRLLESMTLYDEALSVYDEYLSIENLEDQTKYPLTFYDKLLCIEQQAIDYYLEGDYDNSYNIFRKESEVYNNIPENNYRGNINDWYNYLTKSIINSHDNSELFFEEFFKIGSKTIELWIEKIDSLITWRNLVKPLTYCNILLNKNPENIQILVEKAKIYYKRSSINSAKEVCEEILEIEPDNDEAKNYLFCIQVRLNKYKQAYKILQTMKINYSEIKYYLSQLADKLLKNRDYEEAHYCYQKIFEEEGENIHVVDKIKKIWIRTKDTDNQEKSKYYMDWINTINFKHKTNTCPKCHGKLIPIRYGYIIPDENDDEEYILGGCCVTGSDPTDYCKNCEESINMGTYGIDLTMDDYNLYIYTKTKIQWITEYIEEKPENTAVELRKDAKNIGLNKQEFDTFLEKLIEIGHITIENKKVKLAPNYKEFNTLYH